MSEDNSLKRIQEILGPEFSREEIHRLIEANPSLREELESLQPRFADLKRSSQGELPGNFTQKVMAKVRALPSEEPWWKNFFTIPRIALATGLTTALILGFWWKRPWEGSLAPGITVEAASGPNAEKIFRVRFAFKDSQAHQVSVAGDFNDWNPQDLKTERGGVFVTQVDLKEGTYAYSFFVDGKQWVVDPSADKIVEDGFGNKNSIINL